jgi:hypothetical protein
VFAATTSGPLAAEGISGSLAGLVSRRLRSRKSRSRLLRGSTRSSADEPAGKQNNNNKQTKEGHIIFLIFNSVADPRQFVTDPDPAIFVINLQDANKKYFFLMLNTF